MYVLLLPFSEGNNYVVLFNLNPSYETLIQINSFADSLSTIFHFFTIHDYVQYKPFKEPTI